VWSVAIPNEGELAWQLAGEVTPSLHRAEKTLLYLLLGCGNHFEAIVHVLTVARSRSLVLSKDLLALVERWQRGYVGSGNESTVCGLLTPLERQRV
jgi:hypothetical protein